MGSSRAGGEIAVMISSSLRGEPWQKSTGPRPSTPTATVAGHRSAAAMSAAVSWPATQAARRSHSSPVR